MRSVLFFSAALSALSGFGQGVNNLWMGGYDSEAGLPYGGTNIDFQSGSPDIYYVNREMSYHRTSANISDSTGALLFATNGYYLVDATGDTMMNGTGLNPSFYTDIFPDGLNLFQSGLIIPKPGDPEIYYLIHGTYDDFTTTSAQYLYLTAIDRTLNGGLGGVVSKNEVLIADTLNLGKITAVKHANGRDWWIFCHKANSNTFYRLLIDPQGISSIMTQNIGVVRPPDAGQVCFSPDGTKFAYYWGEADLDIFDFDRCTGLFSNPVHIDIDDYNQVGGVAFSPSSQLLYVSSVLDVYQYDVTVPDIEASMVHIAQWDSFYSPSPPFATVFDIAQLAPDGKIYIGTGNSTFRMHVINNPDQPGLACNMVQHGIELPTYYMNSLPNHPNYFLGPLEGSPCDTLALGVVEHPPPLAVSAYPNPSASNHFTLSYTAQPTVGELEVRDAAGRVVLHERLPQWSTLHPVELTGQAAGMYQCKLTWANGSVATHIILER